MRRFSSRFAYIHACTCIPLASVSPPVSPASPSLRPPIPPISPIPPFHSTALLLRASVFTLSPAIPPHLMQTPHPSSVPLPSLSPSRSVSVVYFMHVNYSNFVYRYRYHSFGNPLDTYMHFIITGLRSLGRHWDFRFKACLGTRDPTRGFFSTIFFAYELGF